MNPFFCRNLIKPLTNEGGDCFTFSFPNSKFYLAFPFIVFCFLTFNLTTNFVFASEIEGTIDPAYKYAWGENIGWLNFGCAYCNVKITDSKLTGYVWSENYGWINLNPAASGVKNDSKGNLSGYGWGENLGWIDFSGVKINSFGKFTGAASGTISGIINFDCANCDVRTDWRSQDGEICTSWIYSDWGSCVNGQQTRTIISSFPVGCSGGNPILSQACVSDGGISSFLPLRPPEGGFRILINNNAKYTNSPTVTLNLFGGPDAARMVISNFSDFRDAAQEKYQTFKDWNLCQGLTSCPEGVYTVYVKFYAPWNASSEIISDSIIYRKLSPPKIKPPTEKPSIIERIAKILKPLIPEVFKPKPPEIPPEEVAPKEAPLAFQGKWQLLSPKPIREFVLAPLPKEIQKLTEKFPELGETLKKIGITKITDVAKLKSLKLTLPGLTKKVGLPTAEIQPGKFALPKSVPVAKLSPEIKQQLPSDIVFARTGGELIDFNTTLIVNEKGEAQQRIKTISGKPLKLVVKPDKPVKNVKGYVAFKSKASRPTSLDLPLNSLLASMIFANPVFAKPQKKPVRVEEKLVLLEFEYTDPDGDGIYTAEIQAPLVDGEYEIITVMDFEDPELGKKEIRLITVVDPEGYIYEKDGDKETRIPGAIVSLFWLNPETKQYELWPAKEYQQENPQTTDVRGTYSFLTPEGYYYLKVEAPGYLVYDGKPFQVKEGSGVHINIELKTKYWWLKIVDWQTILLIIVILLLLFNFYKDRIREKQLAK